MRLDKVSLDFRRPYLGRLWPPATALNATPQIQKKANNKRSLPYASWMGRCGRFEVVGRGSGGRPDRHAACAKPNGSFYFGSWGTTHDLRPNSSYDANDANYVRVIPSSSEAVADSPAHHPVWLPTHRDCVAKSTRSAGSIHPRGLVRSATILCEMAAQLISYRFRILGNYSFFGFL